LSFILFAAEGSKMNRAPDSQLPLPEIKRRIFLLTKFLGAAGTQAERTSIEAALRDLQVLLEGKATSFDKGH
jgi:hypothetical protein